MKKFIIQQYKSKFNLSSIVLVSIFLMLMIILTSCGDLQELLDSLKDSDITNTETDTSKNDNQNNKFDNSENKENQKSHTTKSRDKALFYAINSENIAEINKALQNGANINALWVDSSNPQGLTPLMYAISSYSDKAIVTINYLISKGADVNIPDVAGNTLLLRAARDNNFERFEYIFNLANTDINVANNNGENVVFLAGGLHITSHKNSDTNQKLQFLKEKKISFNVKNKNDLTVLEEYISKTYPSTDIEYENYISHIKTLVELGSEVTPAVILSVIKQSRLTPDSSLYKDLIQYLHSLNKNISGKEIEYGLHLTNNLEVIKYLVENFDIDIDNINIFDEEKDPFYPRATNRTPLITAVTDPYNGGPKNTQKIATYLLSQGADITARDIYGYTALNLAIIDYDLFKTLIDAGVNINNRGYGSLYPIFQRSSFTFLLNVNFNEKLLKLLHDNGYIGLREKEYRNFLLKTMIVYGAVDSLLAFIKIAGPDASMVYQKLNNHDMNYPLWELVISKRFLSYNVKIGERLKLVKAIVENGLDLSGISARNGMDILTLAKYWARNPMSLVYSPEEAQEYKDIVWYLTNLKHGDLKIYLQ